MTNLQRQRTNMRHNSARHCRHDSSLTMESSEIRDGKEMEGLNDENPTKCYNLLVVDLILN